MFTGIIECLGKLKRKEEIEGNILFEIEADFTSELKVDQSIVYNGVCLTVIKILDRTYYVTVIAETIRKTNFARLRAGDCINLERSMPANGRFDGHIVQGHVDQTAICKSIEDDKGSWILTFEYLNREDVTVEKGSICVNGISLTVFNSKENQFSVAIIPYTWENTNLRFLQVRDLVNLEFDIIGKYLKKIHSRNY